MKRRSQKHKRDREAEEVYRLTHTTLTTAQVRERYEADMRSLKDRLRELLRERNDLRSCKDQHAHIEFRGVTCQIADARNIVVDNIRVVNEQLRALRQKLGVV